ncbi:MAG: tRNA uridine(34) 5-carboxymethylaminomethyl modification radical SAM/GNAT enzyme Elp3 [Candidatus Hodarchaeales archaeon]|jgi:elongator complex protein 3
MAKNLTDSLHMALESIILAIVNDPEVNNSKLESLKRKIAKEYNLNRFVRNSEIIDFIESTNILTDTDKDALRLFLRVRKVRTISGIAVVALMTKPSPCPGKCIYCPDVSGAPKSYTGREPAAMRGIENEFDPRKQVEARLKQLKAIGHPLDKIHLVIMGGTFLANPEEYQTHFIKECLDGITGKTSSSLQMAKNDSDQSHRRNVGITFETRPDYSKKSHINRILELGGTWVEIGVQSLSNDVLNFVQRHHTIQDVERAIRYARDGGLKITLHLMPNLFQTPEEDVQMFKTMYTDPHYIPDAVKIYPTLVLQNTQLFDLWQKKKYVPYDSDKVVEVIAQIKEITPEFVRIQRVQRDIPAYLITDGVRYGNLRELAERHLRKKGGKCSCIRCREVGHQILRKNQSWLEKKKLIHSYEYLASDGIEHFISFDTDDKKTLFGFLRLRETSNDSFRPEIKDQNAVIIRELHVYGQLVGLGQIPGNLEWQHRGLGTKLIEKAEEIALERDYRKILVTSALGVRDYYRKQGFRQIGPYMGKSL